MKGYKGMDANMKCRGMQFEVGKTYHVDGHVAVCERGLHFCEELNDVFNYYERDGNRFFEVEASGTIITVGRKSAASKLTVVRELTDIEINRIVYGNGYGDGDGNGYGNGYGYGDDDGYGYGNGNGDGSGDGDGNGYGNGYGYGNGNGYGYGNGCGYIEKILIYA